MEGGGGRGVLRRGKGIWEAKPRTVDCPTTWLFVLCWVATGLPTWLRLLSLYSCEFPRTQSSQNCYLNDSQCLLTETAEADCWGKGRSSALLCLSPTEIIKTSPKRLQIASAESLWLCWILLTFLSAFSWHIFHVGRERSHNIIVFPFSVNV